jgi:carotenoid cleavage dioxygenase-like enzyme
MKVYFYGSTEKAANKKCEGFIKQLMKFDTEERQINVTSVATKCFEGSPKFPIPSAYRVQVFCEYSYVNKEVKNG